MKCDYCGEEADLLLPIDGYGWICPDCSEYLDAEEMKVDPDNQEMRALIYPDELCGFEELIRRGYD